MCIRDRGRGGEKRFQGAKLPLRASTPGIDEHHILQTHTTAVKAGSLSAPRLAQKAAHDSARR
eukprot:755349-Rhodomonas_salina.2